MAANNFPVVLDGGPVGATTWFNPVAEAVTASTTALSTAPLGVIARHKRITASTNSAGVEVTVMRLAATLTAGRIYRCHTSDLNLDTSVAADIGQVKFRYTTDGSVPTTASTQLGSGMRINMADITFSPCLPMSQVYIPSTAMTFTLLMTLIRSSGTGNVRLFADATEVMELFIEDIGADPTDTGVDL